MTVSQARVLTLPVPPPAYVRHDPWCTCGHRHSGHHVTPGGVVSYCCNGQGHGQCPCQRFAAAPPMDRGAYAAALVPWAAQLVGIVHGDGGPDDVARLLAAVKRQPRPDDVDPMVALLVVTAALAPGDVDPADALSWVTWDWSGAAS